MYETFLHDPPRPHKPNARRTKQHPPRLVSGPDQVVRESLDSLCRVAGLVLLAVVADEDGLFRLGDAEAVPSL